MNTSIKQLIKLLAEIAVRDLGDEMSSMLDVRLLSSHSSTIFREGEDHEPQEKNN